MKEEITKEETVIKMDKEDAEIYRVLKLALEAGRILLKSGAEIFRVEETMHRICSHYGYGNIDTFTVSNAIIVSVENEKHELFAKVKNVPMSGAHLEIVAEINDLSRQIEAGLYTIDEAFVKLKEIEKIKPNSGLAQVLAAGVASGCLGYMFGATAFEGVGAFFTGLLLYIWIVQAGRLGLSKIVTNIIGGVLITFLAIGASWMIPVLRPDKLIIGSVMPLVPGVAFTNAIRDIADSDFISGTVRITDAIFVFAYIAIGVGCAWTCYNYLMGVM